MNTFTASNGVVVSLEGPTVSVFKGGVTDKVVGVPRVEALREFFRAEEDERLGRWRSQQTPGWTAVIQDETGLIIFSHEDGGRRFVVGSRNDTLAGRSETLKAVAREFFDAHSEPKPWDDAKEGEVWVITPVRGEGEEYPAIFQAGKFRDHGGFWEAKDLVFARRIWPRQS